MRILRRLVEPEADRYNFYMGDVDLSQQPELPIVSIVGEVISALGLQSPFDTLAAIPDLSEGPVREALLRTTCIRDWKQSRQLVHSQVHWPEGQGPDGSKLLGAVRSVLKQVGLKLKAQSTRVGSRPREYLGYKLDPSEATKMRELVGLRQEDGEAAGRWAQIMA